MQGTSPHTLNLIQDSRIANTIMNPLRIEMLQKLQHEGSATTLAKELGLPRQKVNYHLRELEKNGLVEQIGERKKGNCIERIVRATAKSYIINPETLGPLAVEPGEIKDKFSSTYLLAVASKIIQELALLRTRAHKAKKKLPTMTLQTEIKFENAAARNAFAEELTQTVAKLTMKYHKENAPRGRIFKFILGSYPKITKS